MLAKSIAIYFNFTLNMSETFSIKFDFVGVHSVIFDEHVRIVFST